jgi:hypothetical protein
MFIFKKYKGNKYTGGKKRYWTEKVWNDYLPDEWKTTTGGGIIFLPGDVGGLQQKLMLLLGEYHAGNTNTFDEIVAILYKLRHRNVISEHKYRSISAKLL